MRRLGYHHLIHSDGSQEDMVVVEVDEQGRYVSHHRLVGEEPFVEWVGGTMIVHSSQFIVHSSQFIVHSS